MCSLQKQSKQHREIGALDQQKIETLYMIKRYLFLANLSILPANTTPGLQGPKLEPFILASFQFNESLDFG
jgi:hypothetical protein